MAIEVNNKTRQKIDTSWLTRLVQAFQADYGYAGYAVSIGLVGDRVMRRLNRDYRGLDKVTDVLSFPEESEDMPGPARHDLGEVIIDLAQIKRQSVKAGRSEREELAFILVHGLLHLAGYEDKTEAGRCRMNERARDFLKTQAI